MSVSSLQFLGKQRQIEKRTDHLDVSLAKECCAAECSAPDQSMLCGGAAAGWCHYPELAGTGHSNA